MDNIKNIDLGNEYLANKLKNKNTFDFNSNTQALSSNKRSNQDNYRSFLDAQVI